MYVVSGFLVALIWSTASVRDKDQLTEEVLVHEIFLSLPDVGQRVGACEERLYSAGGYVLHEAGELLVGAHGRADEFELLEVERPQIEPHHRARNRPCGHVTPQGAEDVQ